ncbi:MAG: prepilin-type N-terminal cleavage/methylation domain-containing protein [Spirochaetaceae bacterium]|nr:prepilin-type N-terminal cleavage/methylation domain-containing protein [Spirochaetaceae bacterium]
MNKNVKFKAFTIIELMVSIFITMIIIASFYKLYDTSAKAERASSISVSVNLLGEQILDTIADSVRFIGLNSQISDFGLYSDSANGVNTIIRTAEPLTFKFLSPYGGPITKLAEKATGPYPNCNFKIYNSAALNGAIHSFYLHTQDGVFETARITGSTGYNVTYNNYTAEFSSAGFESAAGSDLAGMDCGQIFPAGTLITGNDRLYTLQYNSYGSLILCSQDKTVVSDDLANCEYVVNFNPSATGQTYSIPKFTIQYLREYKETGTENSKMVWTKHAQSFRKDIVAVRFGFVITSTKDRNKVGTTTDKNTYCIFGDEASEGESTNDCGGDSYDSDPNNTSYVFRRVVYLSNHRLMKDSLSN